MRHRSMQSPLAFFLVVLAGAVPTLAGGPPSFRFETPAAAASSRTGPVLLVHAFSCHEPTDAAVRAVAEGVVDGKRTTILLTLAPAGARGVYSVARQWPAEGSWVLVFSLDRGGQTTALVKLDAQGLPRLSSLRTIAGSPRERDIASVLVARR
jgi:hypothetical protein